jgi:aspartate/methionine/tyrosine aminotransferase
MRFGAAARDATIEIGTRDADGAARTLEQVTDDTRMIVLNSPHNPTGLAWDEPQWKVLAEGVRGTGVLVVNDEEYLTDEAASTLHRVADSAVVSSLSKVYGFPGLRLGWLVGPPEVIEACVNYRRYTTISNSPLLEALALQVLQHQDQYLAEYHSRLAAGWKVFGEWIAGQPGLEPVEPQGTPFVLCRVTIDGLTSQQLCLDALDRERLLLMPGDVFGAPGYVRISYARPEELLRDGLDRLGRVLEQR